MTRKIGFFALAALGIVSPLAIVSLFPPLTSFEAPVLSRAQTGSAPASVLVDNGFSYCSETMSEVDCACFAMKAGEILSKDRKRAIGWRYADPWKLAEGQASETCS